MFKRELFFKEAFIERVAIPGRGSATIILRRMGASIIFNALIKYGYSNFFLTVILVPEATIEAVITLEQSIIDTLNPEYNILKIAGSSIGFKLSAEEAGQ